MKLYNEQLQITAKLTDGIIFKQGCGMIGTGDKSECYVIGINILKCFETQNELYSLLSDICIKKYNVNSNSVDNIIINNDFGISLMVNRKNSKLEYFITVAGTVDEIKIGESYLCELSFMESILVNQYLHKINEAIQNGNYSIQDIAWKYSKLKILLAANFGRSKNNESKQRKVAVEYVSLCGLKQGRPDKTVDNRLFLKDIAFQLGTSETSLKELLLIERKLTPEIKELLDNGVFTKTTASKVRK